MSIYVIGDIQGCFKQFQALLKEINFDAKQDILWFTGDLVNRGDDSLAVLRFIQSLGDHHQTVLGNHDLHLLAVYFGASPLKPHDTFTDVLEAKDSDELINWLRSKPLLHVDQHVGYVMSHAGIAPPWSLEQAAALSREVESALQDENPTFFLQQMYGNEPDLWDDRLQGQERLRVITNYLTRMRYCYVDGRLELEFKGKLKDKPPDLMPWFDVPHRQNAAAKIVFGHWAALGGKVDKPNVYALDTGCVWGNSLTAMRLGDEKRFAVKCG